jgi:hypothetical protein
MRFSLVLAAAILLSGCDVRVGENGVSVGIIEGKATDEWVRTYTLGAGGTLEIVNVNGQIEASPASGNQVEVRAEREARSNTEEAAQALLTQLEMRETVTSEQVRIEARGDFAGSRPGRRAEYVIRYRVLVPAGIVVSLKTENGGVRLEDLSNRVTASTTNGGITGRNLTGAVSADVVNGGIQLDLASVGGDVNVSTTNGGVQLTIPRDARATLDATCVNGGVIVDSELPVEASESTRRRLVGTLHGGGPRITTQTVNGGVRIRPRT